jgi:hypothetical protein
MERRTGLLIVLVALAALAALLSIWLTKLPGRAFESAAWQADAEVGSGARQAMADRLLAQNTLIGLTRPEVVGMLGESPKTEYFRDWDLVYWLGPERGYMGIDSEWLVVRFARDGRASDSQLVTD